MATVREVILSNQKKEDGTWNVKIRVTHQRKINYISTQHYVGAKQLISDHSIKYPIVFKAIALVDITIIGVRKIILEDFR